MIVSVLERLRHEDTCEHDEPQPGGTDDFPPCGKRASRSLIPGFGCVNQTSDFENYIVIPLKSGGFILYGNFYAPYRNFHSFIYSSGPVESLLSKRIVCVLT